MQDPLDPTLSLPAHVRALRRIGLHPLDAAAGTHGFTGTPHAVAYADANGYAVMLPLGANNTVLKGEGVATAPTFGQIAMSEVSGGYTAKYMTADRTRNSNTLSDETDLTVAVLANTVYIFEFGLIAYNQNVSTADIKLAFTAPASPTRLAWGAIGAELATTSAAATLMSHNGFTSGAGTGYGLLLNTIHYIKGSGILQNGANAGSLTLQWAQNTTDGTNLTSLLQGSHMIVYPA